MVRYQEVPAQNVVLFYVLMEFGNRTCAYLYQVADVLAVVLVRVVPVLVQKFSTGWFFCKNCTAPIQARFLEKVPILYFTRFPTLMPAKNKVGPVRHLLITNPWRFALVFGALH